MTALCPIDTSHGSYTIPIDADDCSGFEVYSSVSHPNGTGSWFGLGVGTPEYWEIVNGFLLLMAIVWSSKILIRFVTGRR